MTGPALGAPEMAQLREVAAAAGIPRLAAVAADHPAFDRSAEVLDDYLARGLEGEMGFLARTRELRHRPDRLLAGAQTVLVGVVPYDGEAGPVARYAQHFDYHTELHDRLGAVVEALERMRPGANTLICVDTKPLAERTAAMAAGLGFLGKNGCLITPGLGSYVLIGAVICDLALCAREAEDHDADGVEAGAPWDACGSCTACLEACPTGAFEAPGRLDPRRCVAYLTIEHRGPIDPELARGMGERVAGCDRCQEVCPHNQSRLVRARVPAAAFVPPPPRGPPRVDLLHLAGLRNNQHRAFVRHTPMRRIPRAAMRRNAIIALGNRRERMSEAERSLLEEIAGGDDEILAKWASWALARRRSAAS